MQRPSVSLNIYAHNPKDQFNPSVRDFVSSGEEVISVDLSGDFHNMFLTRERLHQLKDVLVSACERYPVQKEVAA